MTHPKQEQEFLTEMHLELIAEEKQLAARLNKANEMRCKIGKRILFLHQEARR